MCNEKPKKVFFHYLPPAYIYQPLSAFAILKSFLKNNGYSSCIKYWNILCSSELKQENYNSSPKKHFLCALLPFLKEFAQKYDDKLSHQMILSSAFSQEPEMIIRDFGYYERLLQSRLDEISQLIKKELGLVDPSSLILHGFTAKFDQWIPAIFFAREIKKLHPDVPTIIGGFQSKVHAKSIMEKTDDFDFAVWGEGEYPLLELCRMLESSNNDFYKVPRLLFKKRKICISNVTQTLTLDNTIDSDHEDYIYEIKRNNINTDNVFLTIEDSRGCRWNKCKFCSLYKFYKYREKDNSKIISEIKYLSSLYDINNFIFTGSNLINSDINKLNALLDMLIELKDQTNTEYNFVAELTPKNIPKEIIKKMAEASFVVQIGYESVSDKMLSKMKKPSGFIDLLFFVKNAQKYGLRIKGANILMKAPNEQNEDIIEAIYNLPFLRFFLGKHEFLHKPCAVHVNSRVPFVKNINVDEQKYWSRNRVAIFLPSDFFTDINRFEIFNYESSIEKNSHLWEEFWEINKFYTNNDFYYRLIQRANGSFSYNEFNNGSVVKSILLDEPEYIDILKLSDNIIPCDELLARLTKKYKKLTSKKLLLFIKALEQEYLIFFDKVERKVLSIIEFQ